MFTNEERKKVIGGSDIASIMSLNPWKTPLQAWAEKTGEIVPDDISGIERVELGTELEEFVSKKFERRYKKDTGEDIKVRRDTRTFRHSKYEYMVAHIDRRIVGSDAIFEAKTTSAFNDKSWKEEEIPTPYLLQCTWYLGITGMHKAYIGCLIGGQKFVWKEISFDQELFDTMVEKARDFWENYVQKKVPPMAVGDDSDLLVELFPKDSSPEFIQAHEETNDMISLLQETKMHLKEMVDEKKDIESRLKQMIGDNVGIITSMFKVSWKSQRGAPRILSEKMKEENVYNKYTEETEKRVMRVAKLKEGKK